MKKILISILFALLLLGLNAKSTYADTFAYRTPITIDNKNNSNTLTDYQVFVNVSAPNLASDIRFTNSTSFNSAEWLINYSYWNESSENGWTTFWIKIDTIPALSTKTIFAYYGGTELSSMSNATNTFDFYEDFENWNEKGWTITHPGELNYCSASSTIAKRGSYSIWLYNESNKCEMNHTIPTQATHLRVDYYDENLPTNNVNTSDIAVDDNDIDGGATLGVYRGYSSNYAYTAPGWTESSVSRSLGWHVFDFYVNSSGTFYFIDGAYVGSNANINNTNILNIYVNAWSDTGGTGFNYADDFRVSKYTNPEPTALILAPYLSVTFNYASVSFGSVSSPSSDNIALNQTIGVYNVSIDTNADYSVSASGTQFSDGTHTFAVSNLKMDTNSTAGNLALGSAVALSGSPQTIDTYATSITLNYHGFWLSIPASQFAESYSSTVTITYANV